MPEAESHEGWCRRRTETAAVVIAAGSVEGMGANKLRSMLAVERRWSGEPCARR